MQPSGNCLCEAAERHIAAIAADLGMSPARLYQKLDENHNQWPWMVAFCRAVGRYNPDGLRAIRAEFNAICDIADGPPTAAPTAAELHKELAEVIQASLAGRSRAERQREAREAIALLQRELDALTPGPTALHAG